MKPYKITSPKPFSHKRILIHVFFKLGKKTYKKMPQLTFILCDCIQKPFPMEHSAQSAVWMVPDMIFPNVFYMSSELLVHFVQMNSEHNSNIFLFKNSLFWIVPRNVMETLCKVTPTSPLHLKTTYLCVTIERNNVIKRVAIQPLIILLFLSCYTWFMLCYTWV